MKTTAKIIAMIFLLSAGTWLMPQKAQAYYGVTFQVFYDDLSPYGTWVNSPEYGFVWVPDAGPGFMPYGTSGYWVLSTYGWTWVSYYPWGWAPFHYGRWYYDDWYGWAWVPGTNWGPAWVTWSSCDGYYGWAPLTPGINVSMSFSWNVRIPAPYWVFVPNRYFGRRDIGHYYCSRDDDDRLYRRSTIITSTGMDRETRSTYFAGPSVKEVRRTTGRDFNPVEVRSSDRPGQTVSDKRMAIYKPQVQDIAKRGSSRPAPSKYVPYKEQVRKGEPAVRSERSAAGNQSQVNRAAREDRPAVKQERFTPKNEQRAPKREMVAPQNKQAAPGKDRMAPQRELRAPQQERVTGQRQGGTVQKDKNTSPMKFETRKSTPGQAGPVKGPGGKAGQGKQQQSHPQQKGGSKPRAL